MKEHKITHKATGKLIYSGRYETKRLLQSASTSLART